jgi:hypothetical protein
VINLPRGLRRPAWSDVLTILVYGCRNAARAPCRDSAIAIRFRRRRGAYQQGPSSDLARSPPASCGDTRQIAAKSGAIRQIPTPQPLSPPMNTEQNRHAACRRC